jgi:hypothetical protein
MYKWIRGQTDAAHYAEPFTKSHIYSPILWNTWALACDHENKDNLYSIYRNIVVRKPEGKDHLEDADIDGRITLKWP